jgi:hypothetical protein
VSTVASQRQPGFIAACLAAAGGHVLASLLVGLAIVPLSVVTWTSLVLSGDPSGATLRVLVPWLLVLATQPFVAAWIVRRGLELFDAGSVTYARSCGAMFVGVLVTVLAAVALPVEAAVPVLGYAWAGAAAAAVVLSASPRAAR